MKRKKSELKSFPIHKLAPSIVTLIGLCVGLFALKYALIGSWEKAVGFIIIAAFIDGFDGRIARMLNASSRFGAELDSLTDFFNFGIAPALILYLWETNHLKGFGWAAAIFFIISAAVRLARYNANSSSKDDYENEVKDNYFTGVAAPMGASLVLMPMMLNFLFIEHAPQMLYLINPTTVVIYMVFIALLMASRIPTLSIKKITIKKDNAYFLLTLVGVLIFAIISHPWLVLPIIGMGYLILIPYNYLRYRQSAYMDK